MNTSNKSSASASAQTSSSAHRTPRTEAEYLAQQASEAKAALQRTLADMASNLGQVADPRVWTRQYPLIGLGSAAAAGFVVALVAAPRKGESMKLKWQHAIDALSEKLRAGDDLSGERTKPAKPSLLTRLAQSAYDLLKTAMVTSVSSAVGARMAPVQENGHEATPGAATV